MLGRIKRTFTYLDEEIFLVLFLSLVRPHMEYAEQAWSPYKKKKKKRATKLVPQLQDLHYNERLDALELTTL